MNLFLDNKSINIFKSFAPSKAVKYISWVIGAFGTISTIIFVWSLISGNDFSVEKINNTGDGALFWTIRIIAFYWIPVLVVGLLLTYIHYLLFLLLPFLPEPDNYPLGFSEEKQFGENPIKLNIVVFNRKNRKFINCRIKLVSLVRLDERGNEVNVIKDIGANYLLWENGEIERTIDETTPDVRYSASATLVSSEWAHNIIDFYNDKNKKRLSDKGVYKYRVVISGKNFRPIPHDGYFEFIHEVRSINEDTFGNIPENKDIDWNREKVVPLEGNPESFRRFCKFGFVQKKEKMVFEP